MRALTVMLAAALIMIGRSAEAQSKYEAGGIYNHCVREFYDPEMYNWLSYENLCSFSISVVACGVEKGGCWTVDLRAGRKDEIGYNRREIDGFGGVKAYVCRLGYVPVDASDNPIDGGRHEFRCRHLYDPGIDAPRRHS